MSFKRRFALQFSLFVALILLVSCASIYILYKTYRKEDYAKRVRDEGLELYKIYKSREHNNKELSTSFINDIHQPGLFDEKVVILDTGGNILFKLPDTARFSIKPELLANIRSAGEDAYPFKQGKREGMGMYVTESGHYVIASGLDRSGLKRMEVLQLILWLVLACGLVVAVLFSFYFVEQVIRPMVLMSKQMEDTSVVNLREQIPESGSFTEMNQIARNFNAMRERLNKAFEFQRNFVHNASHELRTPLANMMAQTEAALSRTLSAEEYRDILGSLRQDQQRMIDLTNSLLLISLYEQEGFDQDWPMLRVDEMIYEKISSSKSLYPDIGLSLSFLDTPGSDNDLMIQGNEALLKSVFDNLIRNAYAYSPNHKVDISLQILPREIRILFENKGTHLSKEEQEKVMMPFFRGKNAQQTKGFGLGLSIVQRILKMHNGRLLYEALPQQLNRFTVCLPRDGAGA